MKTEHDVILIIPTHSSYMDIVKNFLELFSKNWNDCNYPIIISVCGKNEKIDGYINIYNGNDASLIDCILNAALEFKSKYYICLLGDAFINKKVNQKIIDTIIYSMEQGKINYCSLLNVRHYRKIKSFNSSLRYINSKDRYSHTFIAFIANNYYLKNVLSKFHTDLEYEMGYINIEKEYYFEHDLIVKNNYLGILPGIRKGKWNRIFLYKLKKDNPEIVFSKRPVESIVDTIYGICAYSSSYLPEKIRIAIKNSKFLHKKQVSKK